MPILWHVKLYEVYKPIAKTSLNMPAGIVIDIVYGFYNGRGYSCCFIKACPAIQVW